MKKLPHFKWSSELGGIFASLNFDPSSRPRIEINISLTGKLIFARSYHTFDIVKINLSLISCKNIVGHGLLKFINMPLVYNLCFFIS